MARWLVTGGVGFIGHHLCRALLQRGDSLVVLDDFSNAPYPTQQKRRNAQELAEAYGTRFELIEGCVTDVDVVERAITKDLAGVVHLAGLAGVRPSILAPARYAKVNVEGTAVLLERVRACGLRRFVFASSSSVYGNSTPLPAAEDAPAVEPASPYAASKRSAELVAASIARGMPDLACSALRFFTVYGPRQRPEMAVTLFLRAVLQGEPIVLFGDGSMRRDFTHVSDIVDGVLRAMEHAPVGYRAYNFGSGNPIDLHQLVRALETVTGKHANVQYAPMPAGDVDATFADIRRAKAELGWQPKMPLEEGLRTVFESLNS